MGHDKSWTQVQLGELIEVRHGWPFKSELFSEELSGRPIVVNIGNFRYTGGFRFESTTLREYRGEYPAEYELKPGDILLVMTCQTAGGEILGIPAKVPDDGRVYLHNQRMGKVVVTDSERVDLGYLYWLFLSPQFNRELCLSASGTKILHTAPERIEVFLFRLPPLNEQRAIARILGALDDKVELNRRMNETLEAMARAIFKSWFVDFDPVKRNAEVRSIKAESTAQSSSVHPSAFTLHPSIAALFPDCFQDSPLAKIPKGWKVSRLDEIADFLNGLALQKYPPRGEESLPVIKIAQLRAGNTMGADRASTEVPAEYIVEDGDVLFSWSGSLEVVIWCGGRGALNQHLFKVTSQTYPKWFYYHWIREHLSDFQAIAAGKATTMGHIQRHHLSEAKIVAPNPDSISAMDTVMSPLLHSVVANNIQTRSLVAIRDALLPKLISGEIRVNDAETYLKEKV